MKKKAVRVPCVWWHTEKVLLGLNVGGFNPAFPGSRNGSKLVSWCRRFFVTGAKWLVLLLEMSCMFAIVFSFKHRVMFELWPLIFYSAFLVCDLAECCFNRSILAHAPKTSAVNSDLSIYSHWAGMEPSYIILTPHTDNGCCLLIAHFISKWHSIQRSVLLHPYKTVMFPFKQAAEHNSTQSNATPNLWIMVTTTTVRNISDLCNESTQWKSKKLTGKMMTNWSKGFPENNNNSTTLCKPERSSGDKSRLTICNLLANLQCWNYLSAWW